MPSTKGRATFSCQRLARHLVAVAIVGEAHTILEALVESPNAVEMIKGRHCVRTSFGRVCQAVGKYIWRYVLSPKLFLFFVPFFSCPSSLLFTTLSFSYPSSWYFIGTSASTTSVPTMSTSTSVSHAHKASIGSDPRCKPCLPPQQPIP